MHQQQHDGVVHFFLEEIQCLPHQCRRFSQPQRLPKPSERPDCTKGPLLTLGAQPLEFFVERVVRPGGRLEPRNRQEVTPFPLNPGVMGLRLD